MTMRVLLAVICLLLVFPSVANASRHGRRSHARHAHKKRATRKHVAAKSKKLAQAKTGRAIDVNTSDPLGGLDGY